jgi:phytoene synthase
VRVAFLALWDLDLAFADVVATSTDPNLGAVRLAWWRERLEALDDGGDAPAEPRLQAVAGELLPRGITGLELSKLEDAWLPLLEPFPWGDQQAVGFMLRGRILFGIGARVLGGRADEVLAVGALWSLVDGAQHCSDPESRELLLGEARAVAQSLPTGSPASLRGLTVLGALAASDLKGSGGLGRAAAALTHRIVGTFPR